ncbi:MAG: right-handed parallel beta-helix repeat-containing protein [Cryomorphaceae bacterium]|nr:MAG: right-handed parallel beta-helix repeat-containing protein [Cryomorphaceae bacterium]
MKKPILLLLVFLFSCSSLDSYNIYIDSNEGDDNNSGNSKQNAWASLVNLDNTILKPGTTIHLKADSEFNGVIEINDSGRDDNPIIFKSYGNGKKPIVNGNGEKTHTILLDNVEHIIIDGIEISNKGIERLEARTGLTILAEDSGELKNIVIKNMVIRDVNGSLVKSDGGGSAILIRKFGEKIRSRINGLQILNNHIYKTERNAINFRASANRDKWYPNLNVIVKNNLIEKVPGDGIVIFGCDGAIVEHNTLRDFPDILPEPEAAAGIWPYSSDNTIIQFNEVSGHKAKWDAQGYDSDWNSVGTIIQNNYSHDNYGGFVLVCNAGSSYGEKINIGTSNTIIRNNLSINDGIRPYPTSRRGVFSPTFHITGPVENTYIHDNIIIIPKKNQNVDNTIVRIDNWGGPWPMKTNFENNKFYFEGDMKNQLRKRKNIEFIGNVFSKELVETEMDYSKNSILKIQNIDIEVIKNKFLNENKILPKQTFN